MHGGRWRRGLTCAVLALSLGVSGSALSAPTPAAPASVAPADTPAPTPSPPRADIPALTAPVVDTIGLLDPSTRDDLNLLARDLRRDRLGMQLQVLIVASTDGEPIEAYAQRAFVEQRLGSRLLDNGVLMVIAKDDRRVRIHTGAGMDGRVTDAIAQRVIDEHMLPKFRAGEFGRGIEDGAKALSEVMRGGRLPEPSAGKVLAFSELSWPMKILVLVLLPVMLIGPFAPALIRWRKGGRLVEDRDTTSTRWSNNGGGSDGGGASGKW